MYCRVILFLFLVSLPGSQLVFSQSPHISINISLDKNEYLELEPVWLTVKFKNESKKIDSLNILDPLDVLDKLIITDTNGIRIQYHFLLVEFLNRPPKIKAQEELTYEIEVLIGFGNVMLFNALNTINSYLSAGKYKIQSQYNTKEGLVKSNIVECFVKVPEDVRAEEFNKLIEILKAHGKKSTDYFDWIEEIRAFMSQDIYSGYYQQAFFNYMYTFIYERTDFDSVFVSDCNSFFEKYPNSFYCKEVLRLCLRSLTKLNTGSVNSLELYLYGLMKKNPGTKLEKYAESYLKNKEYILRIVK